MIVIKNRKHGIDFYKVWFAKKPLNEKGIITYNQAMVKGKHPEEFDTLVSDISGTPEEIKSAFTKNCRYKVNRAAREDVDLRFMGGESITKEEIERFLAFFKTFWESKGDSFTREEEIRRDLTYRLIGDDESESRNIIGMANRYLHYMDMLHFKEKGLTIYDWGGAGRDEDVINITQFKESFGGSPEKSYNYEAVKGFMAHLFKLVAGVMDDALINMR